MLGRRLSADDVDYLTFGRGLDTHRMRRELEFEPAYTTSQTLDDFARAVPVGLLADHPVELVERALVTMLGEADDG